MHSTILCCMGLVLLMALPAPAQSQEKQIPDFSTKDRKDVPVEFTWKIEDLYPNVEAWQKDKQAVQEMINRLEPLSKNWMETPQNLLTFLNLINEIQIKASRLGSYAGHQANVDMSNPLYQKMKGELQSIFVQMGVKLAFMNDDILKFTPEKLQEFLKAEKGLLPFQFNLEQQLRAKAHILPADQQRIVTLTGLFSGATNQASQMLNDVDMPPASITLADGNKVLLTPAAYQRLRASADPKERTLVMQTYWENHKKFENTHATLIDGAIKTHFFGAQVGKFKNCLEARLFDDNIDTQVYYRLIESVRANLEPLHRYLKLKKELLGLEKFRYEDIYASSVKAVNKRYTYDEAKQLVMDAMKPMGPEYSAALQTAFANRWVDIYPNKAKETGAYSGGVYGVHPYVKMNFNGLYNTVSTLAHELGHAMHSHFSSNTQHFANAQYPTFLAEIASTFNETMLMNHLLKTEKDDLFKLFILDSYLEQLRGTIYRQTQFAEFELEMHRRVEQGGSLTPDWLSQKYLELARYYYGHDKGVTEVGDYIQNEWSGVPHFYMNYYVFQYSTGMIASMALADRVLGNVPQARDKYLTMLKSGGNNYPLEILKLAGIDMTTPEPGIAALKRFNDLVGEMEKIVERLKKQKKL